MRVVLMLLAVAAMAVIPVAAAQQAKSPSTRSSNLPGVTTTTPAPAPININTASQAQLETLPGVGAKAAQRIIEYRKQNGHFKKVEDLMNVKGFGEKTFLKLKPLLTVGEKAASI